MQTIAGQKVCLDARQNVVSQFSVLVLLYLLLNRLNLFLLLQCGVCGLRPTERLLLVGRLLGEIAHEALILEKIWLAHKLR